MSTLIEAWFGSNAVQKLSRELREHPNVKTRAILSQAQKWEGATIRIYPYNSSELEARDTLHMRVMI